MARPPLEVADIFREHGDAYRRRFSLTPAQRQVMWAIERCRTAQLGGHVYVCDSCGERQNRYNSCRNRHCPKCQSFETARWIGARERDLLPVPYFHVVFTVPSALRPLLLGHQRLLYGALFGSAWDALRTIAREPKHLGASIGALAVLHTWSQTLVYHPHVHFVVPGGGLTSTQGWASTRGGYFLPVQALSARFRTAMLSRIEEAYRTRRLDLGGSLADLKHPVRFADFICEQRTKPWVVYAKQPFAGPEKVLRYLARYTHRVAISNHRLLSSGAEGVLFSYRDYREGGIRKTMTLDALEFIRRFLIHVLPKRFVRIRYFGFLANRSRRAAIAAIRTILEMPRAQRPLDEKRHSANPDLLYQCPVCKEGRLMPLGALVATGDIAQLRRQRAPP